MNVFGTLTMTELTCYSCVVRFAIDEELYKRRAEDGRSFWCPNGHQQHFTESEITKLKKTNANLSKRLDWAETSEQRAREQAATAKREKAAIKGQLTKTRKRIANGVCPCCNRSFANVQRHMGTQHPDFVETVT